MVTLAADGERVEWSFGEIVAATGSTATAFADHGVRRGSTVLMLVGNRIEFVLGILAGLHLGAATLPCSEQLRVKDIELRLRRARPDLVVCDKRNLPQLEAAGPSCPVLTVPDPAMLTSGSAPPPYAELDAGDPAFCVFTSGTTGEPKMVTHTQSYVTGQQLQATEWLNAQPGELVWSTAAPGWSKSTRNTFIAPWIGGGTALLQDARFSAAGRLETIRAEGVNVLCMAPTEYRLIAADGPIGALPSLRRVVTAGEAMGFPAFQAWREQTGLEIADGYGQTETGQVTGVRPGESAPPGSMGRPLSGVEIEIVDGELTIDPATLPTFFAGYDGEAVSTGRWHTGDLVDVDADGWLFFRSRADDVIISAGYRIGPAEVESTLMGHPAVRECAVLGVPDQARGEVVGAAVVLRDGFDPSADLAAELQTFAKDETAPYKYPRRVWFVDELPKTASGKTIRSAISVPPADPR